MPSATAFPYTVLQYIPLCLHFAVDKAYVCATMPSATAFPYTAVHTLCLPYVFSMQLVVRIMSVPLSLQPQHSHTLQYIPYAFSMLLVRRTPESLSFDEAIIQLPVSILTLVHRSTHSTTLEGSGTKSTLPEEMVRRPAEYTCRT